MEKHFTLEADDEVWCLAKPQCPNLYTRPNNNASWVVA